MSWKSLVTAGLFCVLASPAFAAPNMAIVKGTTGAQAGTTGNLNAAGNWIWTVQVTPDLTTAFIPDSSGTPIAAELGFGSTSTGAATGQGRLLNVTNASSGVGDKFDTINPGAVIFSSWQTSTNGLLDANSNNRPTGIQTSCASGTCSTQSYTTPGGDSSVLNTGAAAQQAFAALGSINFTTPGAKDFINIEVAGPVVTLLNPITTTTIKVSGVYGTGNTNGRLTQVTGKSGSTYTTSNFDTFGGNSYSFTREAHAGDTDLDGDVDFTDYQTLTIAFGQGAGKHWYDGDYDGNGIVDFTDYQLLTTQYPSTYTVGPVSPGAGAGNLSTDGTSVPEPASIVLLGLTALGGIGVLRRKR